jgi:phytoene synthase
MHPLPYCAALVREHDPDRYLATLFAPADAREPLFTLYAFDHEIARVRRVVSADRWPGASAVVARGVAAARRASRRPTRSGGGAARGKRLRRCGLPQAAIDAREQELSPELPADLAA